ncbi:MAG: TPP-dependent 2-oxoacid decarboxylase, partial [Planctomycetota bacterium]
MTNNNQITVAEYLLARLKSLNVDHVFGIPGDFILPLFEIMVDNDIEQIAACNELNAGYAADGYARIRGLGAAAVTYGPGSFSIINAVAGAYAEEVPVVIISGGPSCAAYKTKPVLHHLLLDRYETSINIFKNITAYATLLDQVKLA